MPTLFTELSRSWRSLTDASTSDVLSRWGEHEVALGRCSTLDEVVDAARGAQGDLSDRDEVLRSLLRLATSDDDARLALLHVLAPGLTKIAKSYASRWGWAEAESMVAAAALERIAGFGDRSTARPAAHIVLGVRHDLFERALREASRRRVFGEQVDLGDEVAVDERQAAGEELLGLVGEGVRSGAISRRGARLILLHRICGMSTAEVAAAEGRDAASVRKYRNRAESALADVAVAVA